MEASVSTPSLEVCVQVTCHDFGHQYVSLCTHTGVYHLLFSPPESEEVAQRLVEEEGGIQTNLHAPLQLYHCLTDSLLASYANVYKTFNADQPIGDLVSQGQLHVHACTICTLRVVEM